MQVKKNSRHNGSKKKPTNPRKAKKTTGIMETEVNSRPNRSTCIGKFKRQEGY